MTRWTCPRCDREFGRARQSHTCVPGCTVETTFAGREPRLRAIYDEILRHLRARGPVHEDAVSVGVFLKCDRKLAEIRPRSADVQLTLYLPYPVSDRRITKVFSPTGPRVAHQLLLREVPDLDDVVREWLAMAFEHACD